MGMRAVARNPDCGLVNVRLAINYQLTINTGFQFHSTCNRFFIKFVNILLTRPRLYLKLNFVVVYFVFVNL